MAPVGVKGLKISAPGQTSGLKHHLETQYTVKVLQPHDDKQTELASMTRANWIEPVARVASTRR